MRIQMPDGVNVAMFAGFVRNDEHKGDVQPIEMILANFGEYVISCQYLRDWGKSKNLKPSRFDHVVGLLESNLAQRMYSTCGIEDGEADAIVALDEDKNEIWVLNIDWLPNLVRMQINAYPNHWFAFEPE